MHILETDLPSTYNTSLPAFHIGSVPIHGRLALAPMDGISDQPMRSICRQLGAAFTVTEFIHIRDVERYRNHLARRVAFSPLERPIGFQLYGGDPQQFLSAARILLNHQPDFFDINLGCADRGIANRGDGAGLLRTPDIIKSIFKQLTHNLDIPVTAKIRLGWDNASRNYLDICRLLQEHGAAMITVHGRTALDRWSRPADWAPIGEIKNALSIPVIGNGDVRRPEDIKRMLRETGCDGVMIGRGALGNPWLFAGVDKALVSLREIQRMALYHWEKTSIFYGEVLALSLFRKHLKAYFSGTDFDAAALRAILKSPRPIEELASYA